MTVKKRVANALRCVLPIQAYLKLETYYLRREAISYLRRQGVLDLVVKVAERFDYTVQDGPFRGMRYTREAVMTHHATPNLLGTYERQLYPLLEEAARRCECIVDVGSAEGYFAVGLARLTGRPVAAFDVNPSEREMLREMAALNGVSHLLKISDWCSSATLTDLVRGKRALVFCDIDGGEFSLFTPEAADALRGCDIFIELHGSADENRALIERFVGRESIMIDHPKDPAGTERLQFLDKDAARMAHEYRDSQQWVVMRPSDMSSLQQLGQSIGHSVPVSDHESATVK